MQRNDPMPHSATVPGRAAAINEALASHADLGTVFDRLSGALYRYVVVRAGGDAHLADDLMQHVWLAAVRSARSIPPDEIEFWLRRVAKDALNAHWRRQHGPPKHVPLADPPLAGRLARDLESEPIAPDRLSRRDVRDQILLALTELPAADQELIIDHYSRGRTLAQLAESQGLSARGVQGRLYRARHALRRTLASLHKE